MLYEILEASAPLLDHEGRRVRQVTLSNGEDVIQRWTTRIAVILPGTWVIVNGDTLEFPIDGSSNTLFRAGENE